MRIAVHTDPVNYERSFAPRWIAALLKSDVHVLKVDLRSQESMETLSSCNGVMWHWFHSPDDKQAALKILPALEYGLRIPVFPDMRTCWHYDEKIAQHYLLQTADVPHVASRVFWNYRDAADYIKNCRYPVVFKLSVGAGAANVLKMEDPREAEVFAARMFHDGIFPYSMNEYERQAEVSSLDRLRELGRRSLHALRYTLSGIYPPLKGYYLPQKNYLYLQEFIPGNTYDIRITVIGNRAFGFIRHNRDDDFRASGSGKIDHDPGNIPLEAVKTAHDISGKYRFQSMAYDFLLDENGKPLVNEISYCYVSEAVQACPGYWDRDLHWHAGHIWPEDAHVEDFLKFISNGEDR
jgi:glutathione synthase/RimK-type ligase-like ATP-grasp enzyme